MSKTERRPAIISGNRRRRMVTTPGVWERGTLGAHPGLLLTVGYAISLPGGFGFSHRLYPPPLEAELVCPVVGWDPGLLPR